MGVVIKLISLPTLKRLTKSPLWDGSEHREPSTDAGYLHCFPSKIGEEQSADDAEDGPPELLVCPAGQHATKTDGLRRAQLLMKATPVLARLMTVWESNRISTNHSN